MANLGRPTLRITVDSERATSTARVIYTVTFTPPEVAANTRFLATIQLFGEDPPPGPAGDDLLVTFFPSRVIRPNGQATRQFTVSQNVLNSVLDEDPGGLEDEIYAKVRVRALDPPFPPVIPPFRDSNVVSI